MQLSDYDVEMLKLVFDDSKRSDGYTETELQQLEEWYQQFMERLFG